MSQETKVLFGLIDDEEENTFTRNDAVRSRVKLDEERVKESVKQFVSLDVFGSATKQLQSERELSDQDRSVTGKLVALATKDVAFDEISNDYLTAEDKGKSLLTDYTQQRLKEKKPNSKTFAALYKMSTAGKLSENKLLKADRRLLQRLFNAASSGRSVQPADSLKHELSPVPLSLANLVVK